MEVLDILILIGIAVAVAILAAILSILTGNRKRINEFGRRLSFSEELLRMVEKGQGKIEQAIRDEMSRNRGESSVNARMAREELSNTLKNFNDLLLSNLNSAATYQKDQLDFFSSRLNVLTQTNEQKLESIRRTVEEKLKSIQDDNSQKLEQMRATVDEKLNVALEKRLGDSFKLVSERLEQVHKSLGEMQVLASGVGDLKKVLTNVKTRGIWGEIQLGNILEQVLTPEQYMVNAAVNENSDERVEFAIRLPGKGDDGSEVLLPIDAKFPQEDYQKYLDACEQSNASLADEAAKQMENRIKSEARRICEKYVNPPRTTDFAVMFLPTESLYADVVKRPGLIEYLQENYRVIIAGPATMAALLNSLSMGFRTLAIQKRSSEVWMLLGAIKTEFGKFGIILEKTRKKLHDASSTIDEAAKRSRAIERRLRSVEELPNGRASDILGEIAASDDNNFS